MPTSPPVNAGCPRAGVESIRSVMNNRLLVDQVLTTIGTLMDVAQIATGCTTADLAEWPSTTLIRWAEQDQAKMRSLPMHCRRREVSGKDSHTQAALAATPNTGR